jgi:HK97 family phage portal protein
MFESVKDRIWEYVFSQLKSRRLFEHYAEDWEEDHGHRGDVDAEKYAKSYSLAVWAFVCIRTIAETAASVPLRFYRESGGERKEITSGRLVDLFSEVNPFMSYRDLIESTAAFLQIDGNAYWILEGGENPTEIFPVHPYRIKIVPDKKEFIGGYLYERNGRRIGFIPEDVIHFKNFHAEDDYYGLSPMKVARTTLTTDWFARRSNKELFKNTHRPGALLESDQEMDKKVIRRLKKDWDLAHKGVANWHRLVVLEGGLKYKDTILKPKDLEFLQLMNMNREEVCAIFRVPPAVVGIFRYANYANSREQMKVFWVNTILPLLRKCADKLNERFIPFMEKGAFCEFDTSEIQELQADEKEVAETLGGLVDRGIFTINEVRHDYYNKPPVEWGNEPQPKPTLSLPAGIGSLSLIDNRAPGKTKEAGDPPGFDPTEEEKAIWLMFDKELTQEEQGLKPLIVAFMSQQKDRVLRKVESEGEDWLATIKRKYKKKMKRGSQFKVGEHELERIFALLQENELFTDATRQYLLDMIQRVGKDTLISLGIGANFIMDEAAELWLRTKIQRFVRSVNETTRRQLASIITEALKQEYTIQEISQQIADHLDQTRDYRSDRIARTEVIGHHNFGVWKGMVESGVVLEKKWISTMDDRVRDTHAEAHGQTKPLLEPFEVGGALLMFPGDSQEGFPEEVINCRCAHVASKLKE